MSKCSRGRPAGSHVTDPAVNKQNKARGLEQGERHGENKCDPETSRLSYVSSLSQCSYNYNSLDGGQHVSVKTPADVECIYLDTDTVSISSNESDCDNREAGVCISEIISTTQRDSKDENQNKFLCSNLTEEGGISNEPMLYISPTVSPTTSKSEKARICVKSTAKVDFIKNGQHLDSLQLDLGEVTLPPSNKKRKVSVTQTLSTLSPSNVPSDSKSRHDPEENIGNELADQKFCCTLSWSTYMYRKPLQCSCKFAAEASKSGQGYVADPSSPVSQCALELESCQDEVYLNEDLNNGANTVQKESMSTSRLRLPLQKRHESNDNSEGNFQDKPTETYRLGKRCGVRRRKSQGEKSHLKGKEESVLNSVLALKSRNKSRTNSQKKAQPSDTQLCKGKEDMEIVYVVSDIVSTSASESNSDIIEVEESCLENVRKGLSRQNVTQEGNLSSPMSTTKNGKIFSVANISKADQNMNLLNTDHSMLNSMATMERIPELSPATSDLNMEQCSQSLPLADQEYQVAWTDQLSEIMTLFPLGMQDMHTGSSSKDKETTVINQKESSQEVIDICLDNLEDLTKQFDEDLESFLSVDSNKPALHVALLSDNRPDDKRAEKVQTDTHGKEFCCILSYSAFICGEQSKCLCTFLPNATNKPTMKNTQAGRPEPESTLEAIETFPSPKPDVNKSNIGNKRRKGKKVRFDNSQLHLKTVEQSPLTQVCKNLFVKKKRKKTITSTLTRNSDMDLGSKTESSRVFKDGSSSFECDNIESCLPKQAFKAPGQILKEESVPMIDNRDIFPYLETNTGSQLRMLEGEQELSKYNENTSRVLKRKSKDFPLLPAVHNVRKETDKGIDSKVKHNSAKKPKEQGRKRRGCTHTGGITTCSSLRRHKDIEKAQNPGLDQNISWVETTDAPSPAVCRLESSITWDKSKVRSQKAKNRRSRRGSSKRRKSGLSNREAAVKQQTCTKECSLDLEQRAGGLGAAAKSFRGDVSLGKYVIEPVISKCTDKPPMENSQKLSHLEMNPSLKYDSKNPSHEKLQIEANVFRCKKWTFSDSNRSSHRPHVPLCGKIKSAVSSSLSTNEPGTTSMDNGQCHLDKVSLPASNTEVKTVDAPCCGRPIEETAPKEKIRVRPCVVTLCRLPLALERQFL